ncbi:hypothetical protein AAur_pTC10117 (plasmid) [Paenarthrobacter aurescens TC1]|uniref:Uncharacterized protein n=1 Tax=Paenarthrobacter aurescens (strain TC1) TaxID=290340 RepID=A1RCM7_PAEAT|nr:hypothetical protein AAur_pTC10117 [Paenarthrobacter aurescens TC1]
MPTSTTEHPLTSAEPKTGRQWKAPLPGGYAGPMRIAKSDSVAGLPAPLARSLVRLYGRTAAVPERAGGLLREHGFNDLDSVFAALEAGGYLEKAEVDSDGDVLWVTTILGNALAMASFGKPISRKTADRLVAAMLDRAREYNADSGRPLYVERLRLFGSYLDPSVDPLGDVDVELSLGMRTRDPKTIDAYTSASGRTFSTYIDRLFWPQKELVQILRNRSAALSITMEDIDHVTADSWVVYAITEDSGAAPPPASADP